MLNKYVVSGEVKEVFNKIKIYINNYNRINITTTIPHHTRISKQCNEIKKDG